MNTNTHRKNRFLTFCFSCIPGAGQMYLGFLKRGSSLLLLFSGIIAIAGSLNLEFLLFLIPVLWFFSFFDALNINGMPDETYHNLSDGFLMPDNAELPQHFNLQGYRIPFAVLTILFGIIWLLQNVSDLFTRLGIPYLGYYLRHITSVFPQLILSIALIWLGIHLIAAKNKELMQDEEEKSGKGDPS
ncbi:MAG: hypothetical protein PUB10_00565 [Clostridiales bacterium]|nr:hypothetical protein [Clostridiales bacterium]